MKKEEKLRQFCKENNLSIQVVVPRRFNIINICGIFAPEDVRIQEIEKKLGMIVGKSVKAEVVSKNVAYNRYGDCHNYKFKF